MTTSTDSPEVDEHPTVLVPDEFSASPTWQQFRDLEARFEQRSARRDAWSMSIVVVSVIAVALSIVAMGFGSRAIDEAKHKSVATQAPAALTGALAASPIAVTLREFQVKPTATTIAAGKVTFNITNGGNVQHELLAFKSDLAPSAYPLKDGDIDEDAAGITKISDGDNLDPGASQTRTIDLTQPGTYLLVCNLPGHFKSGMYQVVTIK